MPHSCTTQLRVQRGTTYWAVSFRNLVRSTVPWCGGNPLVITRATSEDLYHIEILQHCLYARRCQVYATWNNYIRNAEDG